MTPEISHFHQCPNRVRIVSCKSCVILSKYHVLGPIGPIVNESVMRSEIRVA